MIVRMLLIHFFTRLYTPENVAGPIAAAVYLPLIQLTGSERRNARKMQRSSFADYNESGLNAANQAKVNNEVVRLSKLHEE